MKQLTDLETAILDLDLEDLRKATIDNYYKVRERVKKHLEIYQKSGFDLNNYQSKMEAIMIIKEVSYVHQ